MPTTTPDTPSAPVDGVSEVTTCSALDGRFDSFRQAFMNLKHGDPSMYLNPDNVRTRRVEIRHTLAGVEIAVTYGDDWFSLYKYATNVADYDGGY